MFFRLKHPKIKTPSLFQIADSCFKLNKFDFMTILNKLKTEPRSYLRVSTCNS